MSRRLAVTGFTGIVEEMLPGGRKMGDNEDRRVSFTQMKDGTRSDYELLQELEEQYIHGTAPRLLDELAKQAEETLTGYKITRLAHALQTATRAENDGADTDWIVSALLHDIGDRLAPANHDKFAAEILRPYVRDECTWTVEHHGSFQKIYYMHHYGGDPEERRKFAGHPYYQTCADFCERWDQASFDPDFPTRDLDHFRPAVEKVFARAPHDPAVICKGEIRGLP